MSMDSEPNYNKEIFSKINSIISETTDKIPKGVPLAVVETAINMEDVFPEDAKLPQFLYETAVKSTERIYFDCFKVAVEFFNKAGVQYKDPSKLIEQAHLIASKASMQLIQEMRARLYGSGKN